jgi:acyl-CoA hydrolase
MKTGDALQNIFMIFVRLHKLTISRHVHPAPASVVPGRSSLSIMTRIKKTPADSALSMTELVLPNDTNTMNNLMGGRLMHWMDVVSAIVAQRHANRLVVTASVDNISFRHPIALGNVVTLRARVTRAFRTSMEVRIDVEAEDAPSGKKFESNSAFFTFVAMDENGKPAEVPELVPVTDEEKELYDGALRRRQLRLVLAGKMKPGDASELKSIFKLPDA